VKREREGITFGEREQVRRRKKLSEKKKQKR